MSDFAGLTRAQKRALATIAFGGDGGGYSPRTMAVLEKRGLVIGTDTEIAFAGALKMRIRRYAMPPHVHMQFCAWCASRPEEEFE